MVQHLRRLALFAVMAVAVSVFLAATVPQSASAVNLFGNACQGVGADAAACSGNGQDTITGTGGIILRAAALLSIVASIMAVIVIMVAGFMFVTANGDSGKVDNARKMIVYTVVGLAVIFLSRVIVAFVVTNV